MPDGVIAVGADGRIGAVNARAGELLGDVEGLLGRSFVESLAPRDVLDRPLWSDGLEATDTETEVVFRSATGDDVATTTTVALDEDGAALVCARPVNERSGIAIVSTVSHELRSPLTSVKGYVSLMLNRWDRIDDEKKREMLEQVHHDADRVTRLVTELLDISRLETGRLVLERQVVDLAHLVGAVVHELGISHPELDCRLDITGAARVYADRDKIEQVVTNLVENAAKYGSPYGMVIEVGTEAVEGAEVVRVSVTDRGEGIPADDLPRVFTMFFRRDHGRPTGTGLGLWISRGLVEAHDGELTATSVPGEGCTFTFTLPADAFEAMHGDDADAG